MIAEDFSRLMSVLTFPEGEEGESKKKGGGRELESRVWMLHSRLFGSCLAGLVLQSDEDWRREARKKPGCLEMWRIVRRKEHFQEEVNAAVFARQDGQSLRR